jgi:hypothetical protein
MKTSRQRLREIERERLKGALSAHGELTVLQIDDDQERRDSEGVWGALRINYDTDTETALNDKLGPMPFHLDGRVRSIKLSLRDARWEVSSIQGEMAGSIIRDAIAYQGFIGSPRQIYVSWISDTGFRYRFHSVHWNISFWYTSKHRSDRDPGKDTFVLEVLARPDRHS